VKTASSTLENDRYDFLREPKDADGNKIGSPNYDPRTLYIPESTKRTFKPFEKQYWDIKAKLFDTVVFFKKGFFYELYEMDAGLRSCLVFVCPQLC